MQHVIKMAILVMMLCLLRVTYTFPDNGKVSTTVKPEELTADAYEEPDHTSSVQVEDIATEPTTTLSLEATTEEPSRRQMETISKGSKYSKDSEDHDGKFIPPKKGGAIIEKGPHLIIYLLLYTVVKIIT